MCVKTWRNTDHLHTNLLWVNWALACPARILKLINMWRCSLMSWEWYLVLIIVTVEKTASVKCVDQNMVKMHRATFLIPEKPNSVEKCKDQHIQAALSGPHYLRDQQIASGEAQRSPIRLFSLSTFHFCTAPFVPNFFLPSSLSIF